MNKYKQTFVIGVCCNSEFEFQKYVEDEIFNPTYNACTISKTSSKVIIANVLNRYIYKAITHISDLCGCNFYELIICPQFKNNRNFEEIVHTLYYTIVINRPHLIKKLVELNPYLIDKLNIQEETSCEPINEEGSAYKQNKTKVDGRWLYWE